MAKQTVPGRGVPYKVPNPVDNGSGGQTGSTTNRREWESSTGSSVDSSGGIYTTNSDWVMLTAKDVAASGRFNPPPHSVSRSFPPMAFPTGSAKDSVALATKISNSKLDRGFLHQDVDTAGTTARNKLWGFQFMYNPTSISYSNSQIDGIDWTNPANTQANLLVGNMTAQVSLYLNRIWDIAAMNNAGGPQAFPATGTNNTPGYGKHISYNDLKGIYTRGTEWDLEYLYRTLNGNPVKNPTMQNGLDTSDWGFISGVPVWIKFNDNLRWKVSVTTVTVNHVMFTRGMVPILSEVTLGLTRIPVIGYTAQADLDVFGQFDGRSTTGPVQTTDPTGEPTN